MSVRLNPPSADVFGPLFENFFGPVNGGNRMGNVMRIPVADVIESEADLRVVIELPGVAPEDVSVDLENNVLTVRGEKREQRSEDDQRHSWHLTERRYGTFSRSFMLPRDVDHDRIEAGFEHGVLTVVIPKSEKARRRRIEIRSGDGAKAVEASTK